MNDHLNDGRLRASLDGEISAAEARHLESCADCQARQRVLQQAVLPTARRLAFLVPAAEENALQANAALEKFYAQKNSPKEIPMLRKLLASPILRYGALALALIALIVTVPSARALANEVLDLFRVQQVTVIPIDFTGLQQLTDANGKSINELISSSMTTTQKPGEPVDASDAADASAKAGFTVRLPDGMTPSHLSVLNSSAYNFTVDRTKAQALLDEAGRSDLTLPDQIDGAVISVSIPAAARADYGTCPDPSASDSNQSGTPGRRYPDCVILSEIPSPTVSAPADVDVAQLAQIGLEFTGMTSEEASAFTQSVDWSSTLVVPIPKNAATYKQVSVDGVTGTLIERPADDAPQFVLLWVKDGIVYAIGGLGTNSDQAIQMANSLP